MYRRSLNASHSFCFYLLSFIFIVCADINSAIQMWISYVYVYFLYRRKQNNSRQGCMRKKYSILNIFMVSIGMSRQRDVIKNTRKIPKITGCPENGFLEITTLHQISFSHAVCIWHILDLEIGKKKPSKFGILWWSLFWATSSLTFK